MARETKKSLSLSHTHTKVRGLLNEMCNMNLTIGNEDYKNMANKINPRLEEIKILLFGEASMQEFVP